MEDDGRGMNQGVPGNGLTGLRERITSIDGQLNFTDKDGTKVTFSVPVN
ncbi:hypothetical protein [Enterococcus rivorum]